MLKSAISTIRSGLLVVEVPSEFLLVVGIAAKPLALIRFTNIV
jgi:hypothetical protein